MFDLFEGFCILSELIECMNSDQVTRSQRRKKIFAVDQFGGKCQVCGYDKCPNALEFHHLEGKEESPSYIIMRWSWERAKKELEKCVLLCCRCHREAHYMDTNIDYQSLLGTWHSIECATCDQRFDTKDQRRLYCSPQCCHLSQRKVIARPGKDELADLLKTESFTQIGRMFGVSDNAVRKWAKAYLIL